MVDFKSGDRVIKNTQWKPHCVQGATLNTRGTVIGTFDGKVNIVWDGCTERVHKTYDHCSNYFPTQLKLLKEVNQMPGKFYIGARVRGLFSGKPACCSGTPFSSYEGTIVHQEQEFYRWAVRWDKHDDPDPGTAHNEGDSCYYYKEALLELLPNSLGLVPLVKPVTTTCRYSGNGIIIGEVEPISVATTPGYSATSTALAIVAREKVIKQAARVLRDVPICNFEGKPVEIVARYEPATAIVRATLWCPWCKTKQQDLDDLPF